VPYFAIVDLNSIGPQDSRGNASAEVLTLRGENGEVLPVFTSLNRFWDFVDKWYAADDPVHPTTFPMDPFRLAEMIEPPNEEGVEALVFDPVLVSDGNWRSAAKPIPVADYCRFIKEIRPGINKLAKEAAAKFGHLPDPKAKKDAIDWIKSQAEEVGDNAGARIAEWEVRDDT
jgi:hypothetical protein